jgi:CheY-like chemotaxis protein
MSWTVLLVEDDEDIREPLASVLAARGYRVIASSNGRAAFEHLHARGTRPAVIVLDLMMPEMDGAAFLRERASDPLLAPVPVVVVTAQTPPPGIAPQVRAVLTKPFQLAELLELIREICGDVGAAPPSVIGRGSGGLPRPLAPVLVEPAAPGADPEAPADPHAAAPPPGGPPPAPDVDEA